MNDLHYKQAAYNNAVWCDTVCRAHGNPGEFREGIWGNPNPTPLYYPNAVTTEPNNPAVLGHIRSLDSANLGNEWGVKDSFAELDLFPLGYDILFDASWIYLSPSSPLLESTTPNIHWKPISTAADLDTWEAAWWGESHTPTRQFPTSLLEDANVTFLAAYQEDDSLVAGAITNRTNNVIGLSNFFVPSSTTENYWPSCAATIRTLFPSLPIVGYERDDDLLRAQQAGFDSIGPLRVWIRRR